MRRPTILPSSMLTLIAGIAWSLALVATASADGPAEGVFPASDSLKVPHDDNPDAQDCLDNLAWEPGPFEVSVKVVAGAEYDALVSFPTPRPTGNAQNDVVTMEWYAAHDSRRPGDDPTSDSDGPLVDAPAVLVIHESGSRMEAGRMFARALRGRGLHALMIHLPYYGERRGSGRPPGQGDVTAAMKQGIADARRARDAIAVLPHVDAAHISVQGTSLGGFVTCTAAGLDAAFDGVYIMLAGADLFDIVQHGEKDTAKLRERLETAGISGEQIRELFRVVEPGRVAHRLDPDKTWMYIAQDDEVVPLKNARLLASIANLDRSHQLELPGTHYSIALYFPFIVDHMARQIRSQAAAKDPPAS